MWGWIGEWNPRVKAKEGLPFWRRKAEFWVGVWKGGQPIVGIGGQVKSA